MEYISYWKVGQRYIERLQYRRHVPKVGESKKAPGEQIDRRKRNRDNKDRVEEKRETER